MQHGADKRATNSPALFQGGCSIWMYPGVETSARVL